MAKQIKALTDLKPQRSNANLHTERGLGVLRDSLQRDGWIGAMTIAADGETFDGSARLEVGVDAGFGDAIVVESDGTRPVIVKRTDIASADDPKAKRLGVAANRVAQLDLNWDSAVLAELESEGDALKGLFSADELLAELNQAPEIEGDESGLRDEYSPNVGEVVYEPKETNHKVSDLFNEDASTRFEGEIAAIKDRQIQKMLRARAAFFTAFNFSKIADYYAYQATPQEKALFEKMALVLLDRDGLIANGFASIVEEVKEENGFNDTDERE